MRVDIDGEVGRYVKQEAHKVKVWENANIKQVCKGTRTPLGDSQLYDSTALGPIFLLCL